MGDEMVAQSSARWPSSEGDVEQAAVRARRMARDGPNVCFNNELPFGRRPLV
jgi:hypothetical protein